MLYSADRSPSRFQLPGEMWPVQAMSNALRIQRRLMVGSRVKVCTDAFEASSLASVAPFAGAIAVCQRGADGVGEGEAEAVTLQEMCVGRKSSSLEGDRAARVQHAIQRRRSTHQHAFNAKSILPHVMEVGRLNELELG